ncbi:MAG: hypothetical protein LLG04_10260 [Parachlamydia sp.]|nr:hypothetical protein [Parachlamydia sp.]
MFVGNRNGYSHQPQFQRGGGQQEQDAQLRFVQESFTHLARQTPESIKATCQLLGRLAPQKNSLQAIQQSVIQELRISKQQLKATQDNLEKLVARIRELDCELPKVKQNYEGAGNGERLFRRTTCVLGAASVLALATCGYGRLLSICLGVSGLSAAFWALCASPISSSKKEVDQLTEESNKHIQDIEAARSQEGRLAGRIREIVMDVQEAAEVAKITVQTVAAENDQADQIEPIESASSSDEEERQPRYQRRIDYADRWDRGRTERHTEERQQEIDYFYNLLRMQSAARSQQDERDDSDSSDTDEGGLNLWNEN